MMTEKEDCHCDVSGQLAEIRGMLNDLTTQIQSMRRERLPASPEKIRELLASICEIFQDDEFTAFDVFLEFDDDKALTAVVSKCLKGTGKLTIRRLSLVLSKSVGRYGQYNLKRCDKTRLGRYYKVVME